jgi:hypothetical protein
MLRQRVHVLACATLASAMLCGPALADDAQPDHAKVAPPGGENAKLNDHFTGGVAQTGDFPGRLICLRSKESFVPLSAEDCGAAGSRIYALELKGEKSVYPIKAGGDPVEQQIHQLLGKPVVVTGRYESSTGILLASSIKERKENPS